MFTRTLVRWVINAIALFVAASVFQASGRIAADTTGILVVAVILGLINALIRPILVFLTCPLIILTLGLFTLVINAAVLEIAGLVADKLNFHFYIADFGTALLAALIVSIVSFILSIVLHGELERK